MGRGCLRSRLDLDDVVAGWVIVRLASGSDRILRVEGGAGVVTARGPI